MVQGNRADGAIDFYHWTRDAALTFKAIVDRFVNEYDADLQKLIQNCKNPLPILVHSLAPIPRCLVMVCEYAGHTNN